MTLITALVFFVLNSSIYELQFQDIDGNTQPMSQFQGKKILFVNIATGSQFAPQLAGLQELHQQYGDSVVVIGFPSNSFGGENRTNAEIKAFCQSIYGVSFILAAKSELTGPGIHPLYYWLNTKSENGMSDMDTQGNFQKFLVSESGKLVGVFSPGVKPMDPEITSALAIQYDEIEAP